jgi:DNA-binding response OmpR family regulator
MQMNRLFLIHWNQAEAEEYARKLITWEVEIESEDGARASKAIKANPPDIVVIYLTRLPSHGRQTAKHLSEAGATRDLSIIFVGGKPDAVEKTKTVLPDTFYIPEEDLATALNQFRSTEYS